MIKARNFLQELAQELADSSAQSAEGPWRCR